MSIIDEISKIESQFNLDFNLIKSNELNLEEVKYKYLGRRGLISNIYSLLPQVDNSKKPEVGKK